MKTRMLNVGQKNKNSVVTSQQIMDIIWLLSAYRSLAAVAEICFYTKYILKRQSRLIVNCAQAEQKLNLKMQFYISSIIALK